MRVLDQMRIGNDQSYVKFEWIEAHAQNPAGLQAVCCSVEARCESFAGKVEDIWFDADDVDSFLSAFQALEEKRKGSVALLNMSSLSEYNPFRFEIFSVDEAGHFAVLVELLKVTYGSEGLFPLKVSVRFPIDSGDLPSMLVGFRKLLNHRLVQGK